MDSLMSPYLYKNLCYAIALPDYTTYEDYS